MWSVHSLINKITSAITAILLVLIGHFFYTGYDVSASYDLLSTSKIWLYGVTYAVLASFIIEYVLRRMEIDSKKGFTFSYALAGYIGGAILFLPALSGSAGWYFYVVMYLGIFLGIGFILFYGIQKILSDSLSRMILTLTVALSTIFLLIWVNPTLSDHFKSEYQGDRYIATFENLNGQEEVYIPVRAGEQYIVEVDWDVEDSGRRGLKWPQDNLSLGSVEGTGDWTYRFQADKEGEIKLIYHGHEISGDIKITWSD
ncbi:hypothetical protein CEY16_09955 [Halalkalibacillus sediminis]|uniref:Uncharacterized protein n=1 Tax=Halalkalibacillus sediminis TaxID=2018042 RepID=A0A2I0QRV2_9BACI|nr:hypothetical protein [Halalkalibacillus sediminis]PKR77062.1 hypothetical protein CEY16_09955 [Halalkalibacillus sediminis]